MQSIKLDHIPTTADDIKVGDIFACSWGATMLMVDYYKVISRTKCYVTIRELNTVEESTGFLSGTCMPVVDEFADYSSCYTDARFEDKDGKVYAQYRVKISDYKDGEGNRRPCLKIKAWKTAYPWNGSPKSFNHCD